LPVFDCGRILLFLGEKETTYIVICETSLRGDAGKARASNQLFQYRKHKQNFERINLFRNQHSKCRSWIWMKATLGTLDICFCDAFDPPQNHNHVFVPEKSVSERGWRRRGSGRSASHSS
jgi:hypothetical protein